MWFPFGTVDNGAGFTPADIANLQMHFDRQDASTITIGTAPDISDWDDKSSQAHVATQSTVANRPHDAAVNGNDGVQFDGTNDVLRDSSAGALVSPPFTIGLVITPTSVAAGTGDAVRLRSGTTSVFRMRKDGSTFRATEGTGGATTDMSISAVLAVNETRWFIARFRNSGVGTSDLLDDQANSASASLAASISDIDDLNIGANANGASPFPGYVHEVVGYNRFITDSERTQLGDYFDARWTIG